jgi:hypothetical protein
MSVSTHTQVRRTPNFQLTLRMKDVNRSYTIKALMGLAWDKSALGKQL